MSSPSLKSSQSTGARVVVSAARSRLLIQMENLMKSLSTIAVAVLLIATPACFAQQVVGSTKVGVAYAEIRDVTTGWSTKRQVLGKNVFNDNGETIGKIDDIIVAPDKAVSYAIIGAGGFLGVGRHDVAIPVGQLKENGGKFHPSGWFEGRNQGFA